MPDEEYALPSVTHAVRYDLCVDLGDIQLEAYKRKNDPFINIGISNKGYVSTTTGAWISAYAKPREGLAVNLDDLITALVYLREQLKE